MENFLSTIAQVSFTIVGLFFVAITSDFETRNFWLSRMPYNRYTYLTFLVMLFPGFMALTSLVSVDVNKFPAWIIAAIIFFLIYSWIYIQFRGLKKHQDYKEISQLEYKLDISGLALLHTVFLSVIPLLGLLSYFKHDIISLEILEIILRIYLSLSVLSGVLPVIVFSRELPENRFKIESASQIEVRSEIVSYEKPVLKEQKQKNNSLFFIITALLAFIIGWLFRNKT